MNEIPPMVPSAEKPKLTPVSELPQDQIEMWELYMDKNPDVVVPPEKKRECGPEIAEFEGLIASFEATHSLEELHAITDDLPSEGITDNRVRQVAKIDLESIGKKLNKLKEETDISDEKFQELRAEYNRLSKAVGMITGDNKVDHTR